MAEVLVLVELNPAGDGVRKTTLEALTAARALGEPSAVVVGAPGTAAHVQDALAGGGAAKVCVAESEEVDAYLVAPKAEVLAQLVGSVSPAAVVVPSSPEGKEIAGRLALKTGSGVLTDVTESAPARRPGDRPRRHRRPGGLRRPDDRPLPGDGRDADLHAARQLRHPRARPRG